MGGGARRRRLTLRALWFIVLAVGAVQVAAAAEPNPVSVGVLPIGGPNGAAARKALIAALRGQRGLEALDPAAIDHAYRRMSGHSPAELQALANVVGADVLLDAIVVKKPRGLSVRVIEGGTGEAFEKVSLSVKNPRFKAVDGPGAVKLRAAIRRHVAPPPPPPAVAKAEPEPPPAQSTAPSKREPASQAKQEPAASPKPAPAQTRAERVRDAEAAPAPTEGEVSSRPESGAEPAALPFVDISIGGGILSRSLSFTDDLFKALDSYRLPAGLSAQAELELYPLARAHLGPLSNLGLVGRYNREPLLSSVDAAGDRLTTLSDAWEAGAKFRVPLGRVQLSAAASYARQRFSFHFPPGATSVPVIPAMSYTSLRLGAGARIPFAGRFAALLEASYLPVLSSGQVASAVYFPRLAVAAVDARVGAVVQVSGPFEGRVLVDYRRYFYSMNPAVGDPFIAGGALDEYLTVTAAIAARW